MSQRQFLILLSIAGVLALLGLGIVAAPFLAVSALQSAAQRNDEAAIGRMVDIAEVRAALQPQLIDYARRAVAADADLRSGTFPSFPELFAPAYAETMLNRLATPGAIGDLVRTHDDGPPAPREGETRAPRYRIVSPDRIEAHLYDLDAGDQPLVLTFGRRGLIDWKVVAIIVPLYQYADPAFAVAPPPPEPSP
jgi:hypothetical protein